MLIAPADATAQHFTYTAVVQEVWSDSSPKALFSTVADRYPDAEMTHEASSSTFTIATALVIPEETLRTVTLQAGYQLISLEVDR